MNIVYAIREDYLEKKGGDTFQMLTTKEFVEKQFPNIKIHVISKATEMENIKNIDCLHVFNMQNYTFAMECISYAKKRNIKIALSPVYWDLSDSIFVNRMLKVTFNMKLIKHLRVLKTIVNFNIPSRHYMGYSYRKKYKQMLSMVDVLLPNSDEEASLIKKMFGINSFEVFVVPNAIVLSDSNIVHESKNTEKSENSEMYKDCVLEVARIEPTKNQLGVLLASMENTYPIVFVGAINQQYEFYFERLKAVAKKRGNVYFLGEKSQEELKEIYKIAKVHVLPSFRESPGLVSLEALLNRCNIVVADEAFCPIKYYQFDKYAYVCNPYDIKSIKAAITKAYNSPYKLNVDNYFEKYSYREVARCTYLAYESLNGDHYENS